MPSILGGSTPTAPRASGSSRAVEWARGFIPLGHTSIPCPCFPQPELGKAAVEGQALRPPKAPVFLESLLAPPAGPLWLQPPAPGCKGRE